MAGGWRLAGAGRKWPSGLVLGCRLVQKDELGTCSPLGSQPGSTGVRAACATAQAVGEVGAGVVVGCSGPGETPGAEAEPVRESWRPEVRRGGAWPRRRRALLSRSEGRGG